MLLSKENRAKRKLATRCGHYEQVRVRGKWKCVACGQLLTVSESIQNSLQLSEVMRSAIETGRPLHESLDEVLGRKEWEEILAKIPRKGKTLKRGNKKLTTREEKRRGH